MVIRTLKYTLRVMKTLAETEKASVYICTDLSDGHAYVLNIFRDASAFGDIMPLFLSEKNGGSFNDFIDCFSMHGFLYALFKYYYGKPLMSLTGLSLAERLEYCRQLAEYMVLQGMSPVLQASLLRGDRAVIGDGCSRFVYCFPDELGGGESGFGCVSEAFSELVGRLFSQELEMMYSEKLTRFCARDTETANSYKELYERFCVIYDDLNAHIDELVSGKPQFRALEKVKSAVPAVKRVFLAVFVAAVVGLAAYVCFSGNEKPEYVPIEQIGTLVIEENDDTISAEGKFSEHDSNGVESI